MSLHWKVFHGLKTAIVQSQLPVQLSLIRYRYLSDKTDVEISDKWSDNDV
jgi:hypothetical protein